MKIARVIVSIALVVLFLVAVYAVAYADAAMPSTKSTATVNIELKNTPLKQAIDTLFHGRGLSYVIQQGVTGRVVELKLKGLTFDEALKELTNAAGLMYTIEDGIYVIGPKAAVPIAQAPAYVEPKSQAPSIALTPAPAEQPDYQQTETLQPTSPPVAQVFVNQGSPVYYGQPPVATPYNPYGYGYPDGYGYSGAYPVASNIRVLPGVNPVIIAGGYPSVFAAGLLPPPPPPGWVSPEMLRSLRFGYAVQSRPYFITPYSYY